MDPHIGIWPSYTGDIRDILAHKYCEMGYICVTGQLFCTAKVEGSCMFNSVWIKLLMWWELLYVY